MQADQLSNELWRERGILENLLYKFTTQRLLVLNGESRWLGRCTAEIETLKNQLATTQLTIDVITHDVATGWGYTGDTAPSLNDAVAVAPQDGPWAHILSEHHAAIVRLVEEIRSNTAENSQLLKSASISLADAGQSPSPVAYTATGTAAKLAGVSTLDRAG